MTTHISPIRITVALGLAIGGALVVRGGGAAANEAYGTPHKLESAYEQQPVVIGAPICQSPTACVIPFSLQGVGTGDVAGASVQAGSASFLPDGSIYANSILVFEGTVVGCGTGKVVMRSTGFNRGGATSGLLEIIEGSGTGGLASLSGTGTVVAGQVDPVTGIGTGVVEYKVKC